MKSTYLIALTGFIVLFGVVAFIMIRNPVIQLKSDSDLFVADTNKLYRHVEFLSELQPARTYDNPQSLNKAADYIYKSLTDYGYTPEYQKFNVSAHWEFKNIIASLATDKKERIIIGAHYDVCGNTPGADDNASAVAGLIEIAGMLKKYEDELPYQIDFVAYTLEEPPYFGSEDMGSAVHAKALLKQKVEVKAMICLEMIGYYCDTDDCQNYPFEALKYIYPDKGNFITVVGRIEDFVITRKIKTGMTNACDIPVYSINTPPGFPDIDLSDHSNYWKNRFKAVMITNTAFYRNENYHDQSDSIATLDFKRMAEVVEGVANAVYESL